jgi:hypothetical protein
MSHDRCRKLAAPVLGAILAALGITAHAEEVTGKVVWIDEKNSNLLLECPDGGCAKIPDAKPGETYTFVIPVAMKTRVVALKEGATVTIAYEDGKEKGYVITNVTSK